MVIAACDIDKYRTKRFISCKSKEYFMEICFRVFQYLTNHVSPAFQSNTEPYRCCGALIDKKPLEINFIQQQTTLNQKAGSNRKDN